MPSYPYIDMVPIAIPYNMALVDLKKYNESESNYHTVQEALLDLEANFEDDEILRIICATAILLQKDWELHDAIGSAIVWERG